ncbi:MAG: CRTAC1 family protein [Limisphaerales bacterium]
MAAILSLVAALVIGIPSHGIAAAPATPSGSGAGTPIAASAKLTEAPAASAELARQKQAQQAAIADCPAFHDFQFTDRVEASGIRFEHRVVDDAGKYYKPVHYDHGNGLAVADVDGDGLADLYFTTQLGGNQLWRNRGGGRFEDITPASGIALENLISVSASFADVDNDGDPDLFVTTVRNGNHLFLNQGGGRFSEVTKKAGLEYSGHSAGSVFLDYDNDGLLDLFVCNVGVYTTQRQGRGGYWIGLRDGFSGHLFPERTERSVLYRNVGDATFRDVTLEVGLPDTGWSGDATFADIDGDGFQDLYVLNMQGDDHFFVNGAGKRFTDRTSSYFPKTPWGAMGVKIFDFNQDGRLDLFVTDMHSDMTEIATRASQTNLSRAFELLKADPWCTTQYSDAYLQGASNNVFGNAFYLNQGDGKFAEVSDGIGAETFWPWGVSVGDLNADGFEDAFVTAGMGFGFRYGINSVLLNDLGKRFCPAEFVLGVEPRAGGKVQKTAFVLDCSGADRSHPYCAGQTGKVPILEALSSRSSAVVDLDNDGDLDLVTLEMNDKPQVLVSDLAARAAVRFLKVRLVGTRSNRDGLGALVKVALGNGRTLTQTHDGKLGYYAQSSAPLYFGLGRDGEVRSVVVDWPSGRHQVVSANIPRNGLLTVTEDAP